MIHFNHDCAVLSHGQQTHFKIRKKGKKKKRWTLAGHYFWKSCHLQNDSSLNHPDYSIIWNNVPSKGPLGYYFTRWEAPWWVLEKFVDHSITTPPSILSWPLDFRGTTIIFHFFVDFFFLTLIFHHKCPWKGYHKSLRCHLQGTGSEPVLSHAN